MAAVHNQSSRQHPQSRLRTSSDPFGDPATRSKSKPPPPPPPKTSATRMRVALPQSSPANLTEAVRDTVIVHQQDNNSRHKARSQTTPVFNNSRPSGRRSQSDDSAERLQITEIPRSSGKSRKKSSQHADVIDRLDFTGVGPMFHHDGPFDACAPSRNKHHNKAPMYAWGTIHDESQALRSRDDAYPSADVYKAFSNDYPEAPKKKVDAIAEAWGIHEPEPFEEFFAGGGSGKQDSDTPASSIYNGKDSHSAPRNNPTGRRVKENRRSYLPPPQPILFPDPSEIELPESPPSTATGFPKRSKSLMYRIRKMRDAPNVPVGPDYDEPPSPSSPTDASSPRPTHRPQNSFLGRFGGAPRANQPPVEKPESYVFIEPQTNKELPVLPFTPDEDVPFQNYLEGQISPTNSPSGDKFGRKTSIMKKVGRVVRGVK